MKTWNAPEVKELNINETANGILDSDIEFWWIVNDSDKKSSTTTPDENIDQLS